MKLRIQGNSLRLRLSEAEVSQFAKTGQIEEKIAFGPEPENMLCYLLSKTDSPTLTVDFSGNTIRVNVPDKTAQQWISTELIGFDGAVPTLKGGQLKVLVEKDLSCQHRKDE